MSEAPAGKGKGKATVDATAADAGRALPERGRPLVTEDAIRKASSRISRPLFLVLGVGLGVAVSLVLVEKPSEVRTELVQSGAGEEITEGTVVEGPVDQQASARGKVVAQGPEVAGPSAGPAEAGPAAVADNPKDYKCEPGANGGSTDDGVNGNSIKVAANVVLDGPGASFLREAIIGIEAVIDEVNVTGICGRKIVMTKRNDSWDAPTGLSYIENYVEQKHFALAVNPSSEGLDLAVQNGTIDRAGIPVIGTDGMLISQYRHPANSSDPGLAKWVWPVATSTVSTMHIMVQHAKDQAGGAFAQKKYGLVYDNEYKFGVEGAEAFRNHLKRLGVPEGQIYTLGIEPGKTSYNDEAGKFKEGCGDDSAPTCFLVGMLLDPSTAITWIKAGGTFGETLTAGPQTLFNRAFAVNCVEERRKLPGTPKPQCDLIVWTGYNPPVGALANLPGVSKYTSDVKSRNAQADVENSFTQGAYLGARVFVEALKRVGPNLTRENLQAVLNTMTYSSDLANDLTWTADNHFANTAAHAFRVGYTPNGFQGWQDEGTGFIKDSEIGKI